jgi:hypothetical protein
VQLPGTGRSWGGAEAAPDPAAVPKSLRGRCFEQRSTNRYVVGPPLALSRPDRGEDPTGGR